MGLSIPARLGIRHWLFTGISGMAQLRLLRVPERLNVRRVLRLMSNRIV
jgi:hypothetical protein